MKEIYKIIHNFKIDKKFWTYDNLTGDDYNFKRSKPGPYIKTTIEIAKLLGLKKVVEIGSLRFAASQKCLDYFNSINNAFLSPPCCGDGHCSFFFVENGFDVHTVDIDDNSLTQIEWTYNNLNKCKPDNYHTEIPKEGIDFLTNFEEQIDVLILDGWDKGTFNYSQNHLLAFKVAEDKLSGTHLILIDDTDYITEDGGKDSLLSPYLIDKGYIPLFNGRQTLFINKTDVVIKEQHNFDEIKIKEETDIQLTETPKVILSLSTVPNRLNETRAGWGIKPVIDRLVSLSYSNYEVHLNIPHINNKTNQEYIIPKWLEDYNSKYDLLKIFRCEDYGAITKILPTILRINDPETIIITVDDDLNYIDGFIEYHLKKRLFYPDSALGFAGIGAIDGSCHFCTTVNRDVKVKILEGYKTISYKRSFFKEDFFTEFLDKSWNDDIIISAYLGKYNISKYVINYNKDVVFNPVVESFPIINSVPNDPSGCFEFRKEQADDNHNYFYNIGYLNK